MNGLKKVVLAVTACASLAVFAAPAEAQRYRYRDRDNSGALIAGGIVGLAVGAAIASNARGRYYDDGYYGRPYRGGYYRDRGFYDRGYYRGDRPYRRGFHGGRRCQTERFFDDYRGRWTRVRRCW